jgi:hypothetical protein
MRISLIHPRPEKDELISLYFARIRSLNYFMDAPSAWFAPSGLDRLIEPLKDVIGTWDELEPYNSFLPLQTRVMSLEDANFYRTHCRTKYQEGLMAKIGIGNADGGWAKPVLSFCPECVLRDIGSCTLPFWNRKNLFPGLLFCSVHGRPFEIGCADCSGQLRESVRSVPGSTCGCKLRPVHGTAGLSSTEQEAEIEIHRIASLLMDPNYRPDIAADSLVRAATTRSIELGFAGDKSVSRKRHLDAVNASPFRSLFRRMRLDEGYQQMPRLLAMNRIHTDVLRAVGRTILLFETWSNFEQWLSQNSTAELEVKSPAKRKNSSTYEAEYRANWVLANTGRWRPHYIQEFKNVSLNNPEYSYAQVMSVLPDNAKKFINKRVLSEHGVDIPLTGSSVADIEGTDVDLSGYVSARGKDAVLENYPYRIRPTFLVERHPYARAFLLNRKAFPRTDAVVRLHSETATEWRRRITARQSVAAAASPTKKTRRAKPESFSFIQVLPDTEPTLDEGSANESS